MAYFKSVGCTSVPACATHEVRLCLQCNYKHFLIWLDDEVGFELKFEDRQHIILTFLENKTHTHHMLLTCLRDSTRSFH